MDKVFIIAEAGVNHNGSLRIAKKMVDSAAFSGVDAIKFQAFHAGSFVSAFAPKAYYQQKATEKEESQLSMLKRLELSDKELFKISERCRKKGVRIILSPFDLRSIDVLVNLGIEIIKIPSGEITDLPYLRKVGALRKKIIMSTGMSNMKEVRDAVNVLVESGTSREDITLLHCNTDYPSSFEDVNLRAMADMKNKLKVKTGYSDHTPGIEASLAAVALGASVIEKHFTLDRNMPGPDHGSSLEPNELNQMVDCVRNIEKALGSGGKEPSGSELKNITAVRKSIVAARDIRKNEVFTEENITVKRPGTGISPMEWDRVLGKRASKSFVKDEIITI